VPAARGPNPLRSTLLPAAGTRRRPRLGEVQRCRPARAAGAAITACPSAHRAEPAAARRRGNGYEAQTTTGAATGRGRAAGRDRGDPPRLVPDRLPDDPDDRLALPAPGDRRFLSRRSRAHDRQPARSRGGRRFRPVDPWRLSPVGVDRLFLVFWGSGPRPGSPPGGS